VQPEKSSQFKIQDVIFFSHINVHPKEIRREEWGGTRAQ
jgi:hypothetical protein